MEKTKKPKTVKVRFRAEMVWKMHNGRTEHDKAGKPVVEATDYVIIGMKNAVLLTATDAKGNARMVRYGDKLTEAEAESLSKHEHVETETFGWSRF